MGVYIRWNGMVEWNGGMVEWWNGIVEWNSGTVNLHAQNCHHVRTGGQYVARFLRSAAV